MTYMVKGSGRVCIVFRRKRQERGYNIKKLMLHLYFLPYKMIEVK